MCDKVMDNSLDLYYLNYSTPNNSSSYSSSSSSSEKTNTLIDKNLKNTKNKEIDENISKLTNYNYNSMFQSNIYSQFKEKVREVLIKEYEIPVYEALIRIKERRLLGKEYEEGLKRHYDELVKLKKETEKSMFQIRQYLDYIEVNKENKESNNDFLPYLFGFESRYKMGEVIIPDILGFSKKNRPELKEKYMDFIFMLVKQFLGDLGYLYLSINTLRDYLPKKIDELIDKEDISLDLCKYYNNNSVMKALKNINNYYNLLSDIIDNGRFNINKFLSDSTTKKEDILKKGGGPSAKKKQPSFPTPSSWSKLFGIKSKTKSYLSEDNKKGDSYDKKVKYILKYESLSLKDPRKVNISNYDLLKKVLKEGGKKIFIGKLEKDLMAVKKIYPSLIISTTIDELTNKTSTKNITERENLNNVLIFIKDQDPPGKFTKIVELCERDSSLSYRDFYTGKEITSSEVLTSEERTFKYYFGIRKLFKSIDKYFNNYGIQNLPLSSDSKTEQKKIGLNILKGIGNYSSIIRVFLNESLIKIYNNDVLVRERNRTNKLKSNLKLKENQIKNIKSQNIKSQNLNQKSQNQNQKSQNQNQNQKSKNILVKQKLNKINKEILKTTNNIVKKKLTQLKTKIITKINKKI